MDVVVEEVWRGERRERLLGAAARVFSRQSYERASMDEIAHEAGVGKPTLYRYFPGKDALFTAVFVEALDELEARLEAVLERERGVAAQLHGLILALVPTFRDHLVSLRLLGADAAALDQSKRRIFRERRSRIAGFIARAVEAGAGRGEVRTLDATRTANLVIGMIWSGTAATGRGGDDGLAREIADLVLRGVAAAGGDRDRRSDIPMGAGRQRPREAISR